MKRRLTGTKINFINNTIMVELGILAVCVALSVKYYDKVESWMNKIFK
jgi:hypothetical protein